jgi:hypothetical protein
MIEAEVAAVSLEDKELRSSPVLSAEGGPGVIGFRAYEHRDSCDLLPEITVMVIRMTPF